VPVNNENSSAVNITKPSADEVKSSKGFSLKLDPTAPAKSERPPSSAKSGSHRSSSKLSMAQKLDSFINKQ